MRCALRFDGFRRQLLMCRRQCFRTATGTPPNLRSSRHPFRAAAIAARGRFDHDLRRCCRRRFQKKPIDDAALLQQHQHSTLIAITRNDDRGCRVMRSQASTQRFQCASSDYRVGNQNGAPTGRGEGRCLIGCRDDTHVLATIEGRSQLSSESGVCRQYGDRQARCSF